MQHIHLFMETITQPVLAYKLGIFLVITALYRLALVVS